MQDKNKSKVIYSFFGPPGSGKGTLARSCVKELGFKSLSTGDLLRKHISMGTEIGKAVEGLISRGQLVPDELITDMVCLWLKEQVASGAPIILDGYPRTKGQANLFLKTFKEFAPDYAFKVICFIISEEVVLDWLTNRIVCQNKNCQAIYSSSDEAVKRGVCDSCGKALSKRADDRIEVVKERLRRYPQYQNELLAFYESAGQPVDNLHIEGKTIEQVFESFKSMI